MNEFSGKSLPIKVKPRPDEILSSWITRLAWSHGLTPCSFVSLLYPKMLSQYLSIDRTKNLEFIEKMSSVSGVPFDNIHAMTVNFYENKVYPKFYTDGPNPWILPFIQANTIYRTYGVQFCPECLDEKPYFRLSFRLAFMVICPIHRLQLLDRCQHCYSPINYFHTSTQSKIGKSDSAPPLTICLFCKKDLRAKTANRFQLFEIDNHEIKFQKDLLQILDTDWVELPDMLSRTNVEYFLILHKAAKIYFTTQYSKFIQYAVSKYFKIDLPYFFFSLPKKTVVSSMAVYERRIVFKTLSLLFPNRSNQFMELITYCNKYETRKEIQRIIRGESQ